MNINFQNNLYVYIMTNAVNRSFKKEFVSCMKNKALRQERAHVCKEKKKEATTEIQNLQKATGLKAEHWGSHHHCFGTKDSDIDLFIDVSKYENNKILNSPITREALKKQNYIFKPSNTCNKYKKFVKEKTDKNVKVDLAAVQCWADSSYSNRWSTISEDEKDVLYCFKKASKMEVNTKTKIVPFSLAET